MFDIGIGFSELMLLAVIAIIVVGPEELPAMLRTVGRYVGQIKRVADDFRNQFNEAIKDSEIDKFSQPIDEFKDEVFGIEREMGASYDSENLIDFEEHNRRILESEKLSTPASAIGDDIGKSGESEDKGVSIKDSEAVRSEADNSDGVVLARNKGA